MVALETAPTDAALLERYARDQAEDAFAKLVERHLTLVYSAALRQLGGDTHAAQDVSQAVFTELARNAKRLISHPTLTGWLYTTTHHLSCRMRRCEQRRLHREQHAHAMHELDRDPPHDPRQLRAVLDHAMQDLREADRAAVLLRFFEGRDLRSVGAALGVSEDAARMRIDRALERLRGALAKRGVTATASLLGSTLGAHAVESLPAGLASHVVVSALANAAAAGAASGAVGTLTTIQNLVVFMKSPIATTTVTALLAAGPLVVQHQQIRATESEASALRNQVASLDALQSENERLRAIEAAAREIESLRQNEAELARLRDETAQLKAASAGVDPLHATFEKATAALREAEASRDEAQEVVEFRTINARTINDMKQLGLAARIFSTDHQDRFPRTFEEFAEVIGPAIGLDQYEFYPQPRIISEKEPQLFLMREKQPRRTPEGDYVRAYALADGSVQSLRSPTEDFTQIEQERLGIASPEVPEEFKNDPSYQDPVATEPK